MPTNAILPEVANHTNLTMTSSIDAFRGISTSAWQALERAAAKRQSAATLLRLLARLAQPGLAAWERKLQASLPQPPASPPASRPRATGTPFEQWAALADAYAKQFFPMQRGDPRARQEAMRLSREMLRMNQEMICMA